MYLIPKDYNKAIQSDNLQAVISGDASILAAAEQVAYEVAIENLIQKYEIAAELKDTPQWDAAVEYHAGDRFYINFPTYVSATSYSVGDMVTYSGVCYICIADTTGTFDPASWTLMGSQYQIFYAKYPQPVFSLTHIYAVGDQVFWKDKVYTCAVATKVLFPEQTLQYGTYSNLPQNNIFPDDATQGNSYWGSGSAYSVVADTLPTDTAAYMDGDNRCQRLVSVLVDLVLHEVHSRIAPRNIPDLRVKRYDDGMRWFKQCAEGKVTPNLVPLQPRQGGRIRYGGHIKNNNTY